MPARGGSLSALTALRDAGDQGVPTWSKDGSRIVYGDWLYSRGTPMKINLFDRLTSHVSVLEGSESLWTPRWSPDGRYIGAFRQDWTGLMVTMPVHQSQTMSVNRRQLGRGSSDLCQLERKIRTDGPPAVRLKRQPRSFYTD